MSDPKNIILWMLLSVAVLPYWIGIGTSTLWDANEAFYAETPRVMIETSDYISPSFNDKPRFNKPPLTYWIVAVSYHIFGVSEWSERLPIVLAAIGLIAAAFVIGRTVWDTQAGLWAAIAMATLPRFLMHSRRTSIDVFLSLFMGLTLMFFVLAELRPQRRRLWLWLMYASVGLGFMTKGPVAVVLPGAVFFFYLLIERRLRDIGKMMVPAGLAIFLAIVVPWYLLVYQKHGGSYIVSFILEENISRYTDEGWGPQRSFTFYIGALMGDLFPWSILLIAALAFVIFRRRWGERVFGETAFPFARLLALWIAVIVGFYSLSRNQQDQYVMPAYLAAAVLVGAVIAAFVEGRAVMRWFLVAAGLLLATCGGVIVYFDMRSANLDLAGIFAIGVALIGGGIAVSVFSLKRKTLAAVISQTLALVALMWIFVVVTLPDFERYKPVKPLADMISGSAPADAAVGYYRYTAPTMVFYMRRPVLEYFEEEQAVQLLTGSEPAYLIMRRDEYDAIRGRLPATRVVASHPIMQLRLKTLFQEIVRPEVVLVTNTRLSP